MTIDLDAIEARHQAANRGPTRVESNDMESGAIDWLVMEQGGDRDGSDAIVCGIDAENTPRAKAKAEFFAHARTDIPALVAELRATQAANRALEARIIREESIHGTTIDQRDRAEHWADRLAAAIGTIEEIGEHSNLNNPWQNALDLLETQQTAVEAERDELRLCLANERGEGEGPSEGWEWVDETDVMIGWRWVDPLGFDDEDDVWTVTQGDNGWIVWVNGVHTRGLDEPEHATAREAMRQADLARAGGAT